MARRIEHSYLVSKDIDEALLVFLLFFIAASVFVSFCVQGLRWAGLVR